MDSRKLAEGGFDYIALGHRHQYQNLFKDWCLYPGALEPIDRNDLGEHGYIEGTYDQGTVRTRFVPFASRSYQNLYLTVKEGVTQYTLEEMLRNEIMKRGGKNIYHVIIQGTRSPGSLLLAERLKTMGNIVEVLDESRPAYDIEKLKEQYRGTLIGDYIERFKDLGRILQMLKMSRKGYQVQVERRNKEDLAEKQKLRRSIEQLNREIHELEEQRTEMRVKEDSLRKLEGVHGEGLTEEHIHTLERKNQIQNAGICMTIILFLAGALIFGIHFKETMLAAVTAAGGICLFLLEMFFYMKTIRELEKCRRVKKRFLDRHDRLQTGKENLDDEIREKETLLSNRMEEYQEIEDYTYLPIAEEIEIDSLNLAMSVIQELADKKQSNERQDEAGA